MDDRRVLSGIVFVIRNGLRWRDAPADYGPLKTSYNRFKDWRRIHTRYDRCAHAFMSAIVLAATVLFWLLRNES